MIARNVCIALIMISIFSALYSQTNAAATQSNAPEQGYEAAFRLIVEGDYSEAYTQFNEIIAKYPNIVYARFAEDRKQRLERLNLPGIRHKQIDQQRQQSEFSRIWYTLHDMAGCRHADPSRHGSPRTLWSRSNRRVIEWIDRFIKFHAG